jgi:DNA-binding protein
VHNLFVGCKPFNFHVSEAHRQQHEAHLFCHSHAHAHGRLQVRITAVNKVRNYISYAMALLEEKGHSSVVLKGMGKAINKTVVVGECCNSYCVTVCKDKTVTAACRDL